MRILDLFEGLSPILYHTTTLKKALGIIGTNQFHLSHKMIGSEEQVGSSNAMFYMSTSRIPYGGIQKLMVSRITNSSFYHSQTNNLVTFVLDGRKLSHNHSGEPLEYNSRDLRRHDNSFIEYEDRVYSDKPVIDNAKKFILSMHILISFDLDKGQAEELRELKSSGIPVLFYRKGRDFLYLKNGSPEIPDVPVSNKKSDGSTISQKVYPSSGSLEELNPAKRLAKMIWIPLDQLTDDEKEYIISRYFNSGQGFLDIALSAIGELRRWPVEDRVEMASALRGINARNPNAVRKYLSKKFSKLLESA